MKTSRSWFSETKSTLSTNAKSLSNKLACLQETIISSIWIWQLLNRRSSMKLLCNSLKNFYHPESQFNKNNNNSKKSSNWILSPKPNPASKNCRKPSAKFDAQTITTYEFFQIRTFNDLSEIYLLKWETLYIIYIFYVLSLLPGWLSWKVYFFSCFHNFYY